MADQTEGSGIDYSKLEKVIDIDKVVAAKAPKLKKWIPGFALRYLKRTLHEDDLNYFMSLYGKLQGKPFAEAILKHFNITIRLEGEENMPKDGRVIFASNHPLGGLDGVALLNFFNSHYQKVKSPVNDVLMNVRQLTNYFIPVNKMGNQSREAAGELYDTYAAEDAILFFPAGVCSRRIDFKGTICDLEWRKTFVAKAVQYQRNVVPVRFVGQNSSFFYNLSYWRKKLGLKLNIEMLYLVDELYKAKGSTFTIKVGQPIPYTTFDKKLKNYNQWALWVKEQVYAL